MKKNIQHWNQELESAGLLTPVDMTPYNGKFNPHKGNVRVGNKEVKWYNMFK